ASMGRPSGIEPDLPGPRPGVLPLPLRPPRSTRRGSNPQPSVCKTAARPVELLVAVRRPGVAPGGYLRIRQAPSLAGSRRASVVVGPGGIAPPSPGFRPGACAVSATDPRWNGTWVLPPLLLVGSQLCICQHLSRLETRLGVEPSRTWSAATCLAVRPTRHRCEGGPRTPNLP